jgi:hypothetical protein
MPLRNEDREWVKAQIVTAIAGLQPHGRRKLLFIMKEYGGIAIYVSIILGLIALVFTAGGIALTQHLSATNRIGEESSFQTNTKDRLDSIEKDLRSLHEGIAQIQLSTLSSTPVTAETARMVQRVTARAFADRTVIDIGIVNNAGRHFADAVKVPGAWMATLQLASYRSTLDEPFSQNHKTLASNSSFETKYFAERMGGTVAYFGITNGDDYAELRPMSMPDLNTSPPRAQTLYIEGGDLHIDGMKMRNLVFSGVKIIYDGGRLDMRNVVFENCQFVMQPQKHQLEFAQLFFTDNPSISFAISG